MQSVCVKKRNPAWLRVLPLIATLQGEIKVGKIRTVAEKAGLDELRGYLIAVGSKSHRTSESAKVMEFVLFVGKQEIVL